MKIGVVGCAGRMGRAVVAEIARTAGADLAGGSERAGSAWIGQDVAALAGLDAGVLKIVDDAGQLFAAAEAVIDFTSPPAAALHAELAAEAGRVLVIGTTGLDGGQQKAIEAAARHTAIVQAANMSIGVNLLLGLTRQVAATLGAEYDIEIVEMHHRHKIDAPSGTALALGRAAAAGRQVDLDKVAERGRDGLTGPRATGAIGFASLRGGDSAGEHTVIFAGHGERVELVHRATSRAIYTRGAVKAALWCAGKAPGLYSMRDVLGV